MSLIRLDEFGIPRPGWPGRRVAIARLVLQLVGMLALFIGLLAVAFVGIWLLAPAGGYPR